MLSCLACELMVFVCTYRVYWQALHIYIKQLEVENSTMRDKDSRAQAQIVNLQSSVQKLKAEVGAVVVI